MKTASIGIKIDETLSVFKDCSQYKITFRAAYAHHICLTSLVGLPITGKGNKPINNHTSLGLSLAFTIQVYVYYVFVNGKIFVYKI